MKWEITKSITRALSSVANRILLTAYHTPVTGLASFPLIMKSGNSIENMQPLKQLQNNYFKKYIQGLQKSNAHPF